MCGPGASRDPRSARATPLYPGDPALPGRPPLCRPRPPLYPGYPALPGRPRLCPAHERRRVSGRTNCSADRRIVRPVSVFVRLRTIHDRTRWIVHSNTLISQPRHLMARPGHRSGPHLAPDRFVAVARPDARTPGRPDAHRRPSGPRAHLQTAHTHAPTRTRATSACLHLDHVCPESPVFVMPQGGSRPCRHRIRMRPTPRHSSACSLLLNNPGRNPQSRVVCDVTQALRSPRAHWLVSQTSGAIFKIGERTGRAVIRRPNRRVNHRGCTTTAECASGVNHPIASSTAHTVIRPRLDT